MENKIYIISKIDVNFRGDNFKETSFERISLEMWGKFATLKEQKIELVTVYDDIELRVDGREWTIEKRLSKKLKNAIDLLWEFLPHNNRIAQCVNENTREN